MDRISRPRLPALLILLALPLAWAFPIQAEEASQAFAVKAELDWAGRSLEFRVELDLAAFGLRLPQGRAEAERRIEDELPLILKDLVLGIPVDSRRDLAACIADSSVEAGELTALAAKAQVKSSNFSRDFRSFGVDYSLPLGEVEALLVRHRSPLLPDMPIEGRASRPYTGIVIFAQGRLPVRGERASSALEPCLFPRIYDDAMGLILDRNTVSPEAIAAWGEVAWATGLDKRALARVGDDPLRIDAAAFFGSRRTDILIPRDEALKILVLRQNLELLAQGRVLIVVDAESAAARLAVPSYPGQAPRE